MNINFKYNLNGLIVFVEADIELSFDEDDTRFNYVQQYYVDDEDGNEITQDLNEDEKEEILEAINDEITYRDSTDFVPDSMWD